MDPVVIALTTVGWLISTLVNKAITALLEEWIKRVGLGKEFIILKKELTRIDSTLESARGLRTNNNALLNLLKDLQQLAYEADDLLDELDYYRIQDDIELYGGCNSTSQITGTIGSSTSSSSGFKLATRRLLSTFKQGCRSSAGDVVEQVCSSFPNRITMSRRMNDLVEKLKENNDHVRKAFKLETTVIIRENLEIQTIRTNPRETTSRMIEKVFGRDQEKDNLLNLIVGEATSRQTLSVVAIVGHGGVGKTTLARSVYNDKLRLKPHFDLQMWVTVSVNFDVKRLTREFLQSVIGSGYNKIENLDKLQTILEDCLETKRFLLVLDDLWKDEKMDEWESLLAPLKNSSEKGNVVLVTSRKPGIKNLDSTMKFLSLDGLKENVLWSLFKKCAFGNEMHEGDQNLQTIGRDIARKLKGNPLAAKTVGALLKRNLNEGHWRKVLEREDWKHEDKYGIMPALRISYEYLPTHLQRCFSYCGLLPEDYEFRKEELVNLWVAQNLLNVKGKRMEAVGKEYFDDLVECAFFKKKKYWKPWYVMHDLLHDLARNVSSEECLSALDGGKIKEIPETVRHLSIISTHSKSKRFEEELMEVENKLAAERLSTIMHFGPLLTKETMSKQTLERFQNKFKVANGLRVLRLTEIPNAQPLLSSIHSFTHLRYLKLSYWNYPCHNLPMGICRLYHLQVLDVSTWGNLTEIPMEFSNLINLRHFVVDKSQRDLHSLITSVGKLANIQELYKFKIRNIETEFSIEQLRELKKLEELCISNLENVKSMEEANGADLMHKQYLNCLHLSWDRDNSDVVHDVDEHVLEGLQPHPNLITLGIIRYGGVNSAKWFSSLTNLEEVRLEACAVWEPLPPLGKLLPLLKRLYLTSMPAVREIGPDFYGCGQCLEVLELRDLSKLVKWVWDDQCEKLPALRELSIVNCPVLELSPFSGNQYYVDVDKQFPKLNRSNIRDSPKVVLVDLFENFYFTNITYL